MLKHQLYYLLLYQLMVKHYLLILNYNYILM